MEQGAWSRGKRAGRIGPGTGYREWGVCHNLVSGHLQDLFAAS